jgi:hypothetical protein
VFRREGASPIFRSIWGWNHGTDSSVKHPDRPDYVRVAVRPCHCLRHGEAVVIQHVDVAVNQRRQARLLGRGSALVHQSEEGQSEVMAGLFQAIRCAIGLPRGVLRWIMAPAIRASLFCAARVRARGFDERSLSIAHGFLPTPPPLLLDHLNMPVPPVRCYVCARTQHRGGPRGDGHRRRRLWLTFRHGAIHGLATLGAIGSDGGDGTRDLFESGCHQRGITGLLARQLRGQDLSPLSGFTAQCS